MTHFTDLVDVAAERLGGTVLLANDEFFAPKEGLLREKKPVWREDEYTDRGKWMDGWETRRRRTPGHDWCLIRLGVPGRIHGVVVDTAFFRGNFPEQCSLEACAVDGPAEPEALVAGRLAPWFEVLPPSPLQGDAANPFPVSHRGRVTHLRFNIFPDGGVARLRVFGEPLPDPALTRGARADLAALRNGGLVITCSDTFYGNRHKLIYPGYSTYMGDGWETRRRRGPGHDWTVVRLAAQGVLDRIEVDTDHFKGNYPDRCALDVCDTPGAAPEELDGLAWTTLLSATALRPDARHVFDVAAVVPATHARLSIFPDGGVARLRLFGTVA